MFLETLSTRVTQLKHHLLNRGYPAKIIDEQVEKAVSVPRSEALQYQEKWSAWSSYIFGHTGLPTLFKSLFSQISDHLIIAALLAHVVLEAGANAWRR